MPPEPLPWATRYKSPRIVILELSLSTSAALAVEKYDDEHLTVIDGDLGVRFGVSEVALDNSDAVFAG